MRAKLITIGVLFLLVATTAWSYTTSATATASGHSVTVYHYSCPLDKPCPEPDSTFEAKVGFKSTDRKKPGTWAWNCHGRTFHNRQGWIQYAEPWLTYDGPISPASPRPGDTVIWWANGMTSHSVTITGTWNGLSTIVMSKYGAQGQYQHALSNSTFVYGHNWAVTRFPNTTIYSSIVSRNVEPEANSVVRLLEERQKNPWSKTVRISEIYYTVEYPRIVERSTALLETTRRQLLETEDPSQLAELLLNDLGDASHYVVLNAYNGPQFTEEFVTGIEAGKLLLLLGERFPETRQTIIDRLMAMATASDSLDSTAGAAVYFLGELDSSEVSTLRERLEGEAVKMQMPYKTYREYYLEKSAPKDSNQLRDQG